MLTSFLGFFYDSLLLLSVVKTSKPNEMSEHRHKPFCGVKMENAWNNIPNQTSDNVEMRYSCG